MRQIKFRVWDKKNEPQMRDHDWLLHGAVTYDSLFKERSDIIVMQFTGLLDKNGKEIYEGDIMEFLDENWLVIYFEQYASFMLQKGNDLANITTQEEKIGNIYENPDLLK